MSLRPKKIEIEIVHQLQVMLDFLILLSPGIKRCNGKSPANGRVNQKKHLYWGNVRLPRLITDGISQHRWSFQVV